MARFIKTVRYWIVVGTRVGVVKHDSDLLGIVSDGNVGHCLCLGRGFFTVPSVWCWKCPS